MADSPVRPTCLLAHDTLNKLSAIIGECELVRAEVPEWAIAKRIRAIQEIATEAAHSIAEHQCRLAAITRERLAETK